MMIWLFQWVWGGASAKILALKMISGGNNFKDFLEFLI